MLEVLMFLFENYMQGGTSMEQKHEKIAEDLEDMGFVRSEIDRAFQWLYGLAQFQEGTKKTEGISQQSIRYYSAREVERLSIEIRGLLLRLEQLGILDPTTREIVIDRVMALDNSMIDTGQVKWVVLMVLFSQPDKKAALTLMQEIVLAEGNILH